MTKILFGVPASGVAIDSRNVLPGQLFVALPGARVDGHHFLQEVASKKANRSSCKAGLSGPDYGLLISVEDTSALQEEGAAKIVSYSGNSRALPEPLEKQLQRDF